MDLLNNALALGPFPAAGLAVGGRTLIFTTPAVTVTLPGSADSTVTLAAIMTALTAGVTGIHVGRRECVNPPSNYPAGAWFYLALWRDGGMVLANNGTLNDALGLSTSAATTVKSPVGPNSVKSISKLPSGDYDCIVGGLDGDFDSPNADGSSQTGGGGGGSGNVVVP